MITTYPHYRKTEEAYKFEPIEEVNIKRIKLLSSKNIYTKTLNEIIFMILSIINSLRIKDVKIVFVSIPPIFTGFSGLIVSRIKHSKFIVDIRDLWVDLAIDLKFIKNSLLIKILSKIEKSILNSASLITCATDGYIKNISEKINNKNIEIVSINNGYDEIDLEIDEDMINLRKKYGFNIDDFLITYIGNIGWPQGLKTIIKCIKDEKDLKLILIGDGSERKEIEEIKIELNIENLILINTIPKNKIKFYYAISDALLVHLRKSEVLDLTIPSKIYEYLITKNPIVYGLSGEAKKLLDSMPGCIYFEQENCKSFIESIYILKNNYLKYKNESILRRDIFTEKYSRKVISKNLMK